MSLLNLEIATYREVDDALYAHEQPYYRYHASGFPMCFADPAYMAAWKRRRADLQKAHDRLSAPIRHKHRLRHSVWGLAAALESAAKILSQRNLDVRVNQVR